MNYIQKWEEPEGFKEWKRRNSNVNWGNFGDEIKQEVKMSLLKEQGYICCYCEKRVNNQNSHVEHLKPKSRFSHLMFYYNNLLCSCKAKSDSNRSSNKANLTCGYLKLSWYDEKMVMPLMKDCSGYFRFTGSGEILPVQDNGLKQERAHLTIEKLGLNKYNLQEQRKAVMNQLLKTQNGFSDDEFNNYLESYFNREKDGKLPAFYSAAKYFFNNYFKIF